MYIDDVIFDDKVLGFLGTKDFKTAIEAYIKKYNEPVALNHSTDNKQITTDKKLNIIQTTDQISVQSDDVTEIILYNVNGVRVADKTGKSIRTNSLSKGIYIVSAKFTDGSVVTRKIVKR